MPTPSWMNGPPKRILLATDLSARCDRALDRATALAAQWRAKLTVLHVLEDREPDLSGLGDQPLPSWRRPPDPAAAARRQLAADVGALGEQASVVIERGDPAEAILATAEAEGAELIVTGLARDEPLGRFSLGKSVDRLLRRARTPVLIVKSRPRGPYRRVVVATDFSDSSRHALEAAARFFPEQRLTLFHAYDAPMAGMLSDATAYQREYRKVAEQDCAAFLKGVQGPESGDWRPPRVVIEQGSPALLLRDYVREHDTDLIVLGTHGRGAIFEAFLGSVAKAIVDRLPCDALIVREPRAAVEA